MRFVSILPLLVLPALALDLVPPLFLENRGQWEPSIQFAARLNGTWWLVRADGLDVLRAGSYQRVRFRNSNLARAQGIDPVPGSRHFIQAKVTGAKTFQGVVIPEIYPGINVVVRVDTKGVKRDFLLKPGARVERIRLGFPGARVRISDQGELIVQTRTARLVEQPPVAFQERNGIRAPVNCRWVASGRRTAGFHVDDYDPSLPLVIDPVITFSTLLGGEGTDAITAVAVDPGGSVYAAGHTESLSLPVTAGTALRRLGNEAFIAKFRPDGQSLEYLTYLGGSGDDRATGIAVNAAGEAIVLGWTSSADFPIQGAVQNVLRGGRDVFLTRLNATGTAIQYSTFFGGSGWENAGALALDATGAAYVTGQTTSSDLPVLSAFRSSNQGGMDAFVAKFGPAGSLAYSTYFGGNGEDGGAAIAVDTSGHAYFTGWTFSTNLPVSNAAQSGPGGGQDAFVCKLMPSGSAIAYATYLGGSGGNPGFAETGTSIAVDASGRAWVAGTTSSTNFPVAQPLRAMLQGSLDAFLTRLSASGASLEFSTYAGGSGSDWATSVRLDSSGRPVIVGYTTSWDLPVVQAVQSSLAGFYDGFVIRLATTNAIDFASYLGGTGPDAIAALATRGESLYVAGQTASSDFPRQNAFQSHDVGGASGFLARISSSNCSISLSPSELSAGPAAGSGSFSVHAPPGCTWTAVSDVAWIAISGGHHGTGPGTVTFQYSNNGAASTRTGAIRILPP